MKTKNIFALFFITLLLLSCENKKDIYQKCEIKTENSNQKEYSELMKNWLNCLINERIKEKSKEELYDDISGKVIEGAFIGIEGRLSDSFLSYKALERILSAQELQKNMESNNPSIKYYSFLAITERQEDDVFKTLKMVLNDTTKIQTHFGCIIDEETIADLCINIVIKKYIPAFEDYIENNYQLTIQEKNELDSIVLNSNIDLRYKYLLKEINNEI